MTRRARFALGGTAALCVAVFALVWWALPRASLDLRAPAWTADRPSARGVLHVHTTRSDGAGSPDEVAASAARAGLQFVVFTDHGDGTRPPDPPSYRSGVLCLDAVEISTNGGHYIGLGLGPAPYPLGGEPREVVEDVARLGGFGIATHPDSPKNALKWRAWAEPFDALEWLNADSEWRNEPWWRLAPALLAYPFRPAETIASAFRRPPTLDRWDEVGQRRRVVALGGSDAHGWLRWLFEEDPGWGGGSIPVPSYEATFRALSVQVVLDRPFAGRAEEDARSWLAAVRAGHVHTVVDAAASPGAFSFSARSGGATAIEGDDLDGGDAVRFRVRAGGPPGTTLVLLRNGAEVHHVVASELVYASNLPGTYRAEARLAWSDAGMPWIVSNPIFVGGLRAEAAGAPARGHAALARIEAGAGWRVEHDAESDGSIGREGDASTLRYRLGASAGSRFAALVHDGPLPAGTEALGFRGSAGAPMRVSIQVRIPLGRDGERWQRSIYLDSTPREITVPLEEMLPAGATTTSRPRAGSVTAVLFVVDRTHARPGSGGTFSIASLYALGAPR